ncbi:MAG TPA: hypothetical protein VKJ65_06300, partial [Phycisphaerae bacterium]|nr:hypothetical protein [Phycisphaerae bacterium]
GDTTPPTLNVLWPQNGTVIAGSNFTMQAQVDDNTATVITVINGQTNTALVERDGTVWVNNLPLNSGTNELALMATDAAGNSSTINLTLIQSSVTVNVDPISEDQANQSSVTVTGTSSDPSINITVNGTNAYYIDDFGDWEADEVPVSPTGAAALDVQAGDGSGNPLGEEQVSQIQAAVVVTASAKENYTFNGMDNYNPPHAPWPAGKFGLLEWTADQGGGESDDSYGPNDAGTAEYSPGPMGEDLSGDGSDYDDAFGYKWQNADLNTFIAEDNLSGSWQYKAQTTVMIVPPKQQAIGQTALYLVKMVLWGYSNPYDDSGDNGDVPLSPDEFTVNGQPLVNTGMTNEDGSIVGEAVVTGHSGALLPVSISGNEPIYSFSNPKPQAQKIDLEM